MRAFLTGGFDSDIVGALAILVIWTPVELGCHLVGSEPPSLAPQHSLCAIVFN
jgi:hypothetical protein